MYEVKIEQGYSTVVLGFDNVDDAVEFINYAKSGCKQTTTFALKYVDQVVFEEESGEEA